jgi:hypothetical protein
VRDKIQQLIAAWAHGRLQWAQRRATKGFTRMQRGCREKGYGTVSEIIIKKDGVFRSVMRYIYKGSKCFVTDAGLCHAGGAYPCRRCVSMPEVRIHAGGAYPCRMCISTPEVHIHAGGAYPRRRCISKPEVHIHAPEVHIHAGGAYPRRRCISKVHIHAGGVYPRRRCISKPEVISMMDDDDNIILRVGYFSDFHSSKR